MISQLPVFLLPVFLREHAYAVGHIGFFSAVGIATAAVIIGSWQLLIPYGIVMAVSVPCLYIAREKLEG